MLIRFSNPLRAGSRSPLADDSRSGFTLVEVLVALAVFSLGLTLILRNLSGGLYHQQRAKALAAASSQAQSILARIGIDLPLRPGKTDGASERGQNWQVEITPYGDMGDWEAWPVAAYTVSVRVYVGPPTNEPVMELKTIRLGAKMAGQR